MIVDIIVPTYNRPDDLRKFAEEISKQSYNEINVFVVDDCSDHDQQHLISDFPIIRYMRLDCNRGQTYARNYGLKHCKGDIVVLLDDDAWFLDNNAVLKIVDLFKEESLLGGIMFDLQEPGKKLLSEQRQLKNKDRIGSFIACACAFKREALNEVGGFTSFLHSYGEETDLTLKLFEKGYELRFSSDIKVFHNYLPGKRSKSWYLRFRKNSIRNDLLIIMMRFPWPMVPLYFIGKFSSHLIYTLKNKRELLPAVAATFKGVFSAILMANLALQERRPVSLQLFKIWLKLRW